MEEQRNGQTRPASPRTTTGAPRATAPAVCQLRAAPLGGLPCPAHPDDLTRVGSADPGGATLSQPGLCVVSCALSSRRRRGLGAAAWRVWLGYHHLDWAVALWRAPLDPRDPSALTPARREHRRA